MDAFVILDSALGRQHLETSLRRLAEAGLVEIVDPSMLRRGIVAVRGATEQLDAVRALPFVTGVSVSGSKRAIGA